MGKKSPLTSALLLAAALCAASPAAAVGNGRPKWNITTAAGFPNFFTAQVARQVGDKFFLGLSGGAAAGLPEKREACGALVSMAASNVEVVSRYHFTGAAFFGGFNLGYQDFSVNSKQNTVPGAEYDITDGVKVYYATPHIGWLKAYGSGFTLGFELGLRLPLSTSRYTERSGPGDYDPSVRKTVNDGMDLLAKKPMPFLTLIRLGYSF